MIGCLWDLLTILSVVGWIIALAIQRNISASFAGIVLVALILFLAIGRGLGGNIGRVVRILFRLIPIFSLLTLIATLSGASFKDMISMSSGIGALLIALVGLYLMFYGVFSSKRRK